MDKEENTTLERKIECHLIKDEKDWRFYSTEKNAEIVVELAKWGNPYALKMLFGNYRKFPIEDINKFGEQYAKLIQPFYFSNNLKMQTDENGKNIEPTKTREKQQSEYKHIVEETAKYDEKLIKEELIEKATSDLLGVMQKYHKAEKEKREFHDSMQKAIDKCKKKLDENRTKAKEEIALLDIQQIKSILLLPVYSKAGEEKLLQLVQEYKKQIYDEKFIKEIIDSYQSDEWVNAFVSVLLEEKDYLKNSHALSLVVDNINRIAHSLKSKTIEDIIDELDKDEYRKLLLINNNQEIFKLLLRNWVNRYNEPNLTKEIIRDALNKFLENGFVIKDIVEIINSPESRVTINGFSELIDQCAKKWLIGYNLHENKEAIRSITSALWEVEKIKELGCDFKFWEAMYESQAFTGFVESICLIESYQFGYTMIKNNIIASNAYGKSKLATKWLMTASALALTKEGETDAFVDFVDDIMTDNNAVDLNTQRRFIRNTINILSKNAYDSNKKVLNEQRKNKELENELTFKLMQALKDSLKGIEQTLSQLDEQSQGSEMQNTVLSLKNQYGALRKKLSKIGVRNIVDIDKWEKKETIIYNSEQHYCASEIPEGTLVESVSLGMLLLSGEAADKAQVKQVK